MSRRGRGGTKISLFAFQDIITSVTAILIVLALFMSLELINAMESQNTPKPAELHPDLREEIEELRKELAELKQSQEFDAEELKELGQGTPASLTAELRQADQRLEDLKKRLEVAEQELAGSERESEGIQQELRKNQKVIDEVETLKKEVEELKKQIEQETANEQLWFALPEGFKGEGWLVVVDEETLTMAPLRREERPVTLTAGKGLFGGGLDSELKNWIQKNEQEESYFLLLIRPSGIAQSHKIISSLRSSQILFGFDVVDEDQQVFDPEKGVRLK